MMDVSKRRRAPCRREGTGVFGGPSHGRPHVTTWLAVLFAVFALACGSSDGATTEDGGSTEDATAPPFPPPLGDVDGSSTSDATVSSGDAGLDAASGDSSLLDGSDGSSATGGDGAASDPDGGNTLDITSCDIAVDAGAGDGGDAGDAGSLRYCGPVPTRSAGTLQCGGCTDPNKPFCDLRTHLCRAPVKTCGDLQASCGTYRNDCNTLLNCDNPGCAGDQRCETVSRSCVACRVLTCSDLGYECGTKPFVCASEPSGAQNCGQCEGRPGSVCDPVSHTCQPKAAHCLADGGFPGPIGQFCSNGGFECGSVFDGCGGVVNCGSCPSGYECGVGGVPNKCAKLPPYPECIAKNKKCGNLVSVCDGRTISCGTCPSGEVCIDNGTESHCGPPCVPESDAAVCARLQAQCGPVSTTDNCKGARNVNCGTCTGQGETCGGGGTPNRCGCSAENDAQFCSRLGKNCGSVTANDNCGNPRTANCGSCTAPATCGGTGVANVCDCNAEPQATTCQGKNCGLVANNCGRLVSCGGCTSPQTCGGGNPGTSNVCGCTPESDPQLCSRLGKNCGALTAGDNCGTTRTVNCGSCSGANTCGGGNPGVDNVCGCTSNAQNVTCAGKNCGSVNDNCGRSVSCGGNCTSPNTCGGGNPGTANVCGCTTESTTQFCNRLGKNCGDVTANDNCGVSRTVNCGNTCPNGTTCGGGNPGTPNVCGCTPEDISVTCAGKDCGQRANNCGTQVTCSPDNCLSPQTCGGGGVANVCGCTQESNSAFCSRLGKNCGPVSGTDNCGLPRTTDCGSCSGVNSCGGGGVANVCGCTSDPQNVTCAGKNCGSIRDNCNRNVNCGSCSNPQTCGGGGVQNVCGCTAEDNPTFCSRLGKNCGSVTANDNCGASRTVDCGSCTLPQTCNGGGVQNVCGCTVENDSTFCTRLGAQCGTKSGTDNCGNARTVNCGFNCPPFQSCNGGGVPNVCGCTAETDAAFCNRFNACGVITRTDNCGASRTVDCGFRACNGVGQSCGGGGQPGICGCTVNTLASCAGKNCGDVISNCGTTISCGGCVSPQTCGGAGVNGVCGCTPQSPSAFCSAKNANCGSVSGTDNCNGARTENCGSCTLPQTCNGGGQANRCGCTGESNAAFCARYGAQCGSFTGLDNCGTNRTVSNCGNCSGTGVICQANQCTCPAESTEDFCRRTVNAQPGELVCGPRNGVDNCGVTRSVADCGICPANPQPGMVCGSAQTGTKVGVCCQKRSCTSPVLLPAGTHSDNCGGFITCNG